MKIFSFIVLVFLYPHFVFCQERQKDDCILSITNLYEIAELKRVSKLDELLLLNTSKDFYIAQIKIKRNKEIIVYECFSLANDKIVGFDGKVTEFKQQDLLFNSTSTEKDSLGNDVMVYSLYANRGDDYHADGILLVVKIKKSIFIGYSIDGCDVAEGFKSIALKRLYSPTESMKQSLFLLIDSTIKMRQ